MQPVTTRFAEAIADSHELAVRVEVLERGAVVDTISSVVAGSVTLDAKAAVRGRLDLQIVDDGSLGLVPTVPTDPLAPYGRELRVSRGIAYPDAEPELVPLGVYRIDDTSIDDTPGSLLIQIAGQDRAARIIDARFEEPYEIAAGTNLGPAILALIQAAYPDVPYDFAATSVTTPHVIAEEGGDRWDLAQKLATGAGLRLYFNREGTLVLAPEMSSAAAISLAEGEDGVLLSAGRKWSRQGTFNRVIATGENTGETAPARGVATDDNPLSPTYYYGDFGKVPRFFVSQFIVTDAQAQDAAAAMLARELGTTQSVSFGTLVLPHLDPDDLVRISRLRAGVNEDHVIDALTIPLAATDTMTGGTRAMQVFQVPVAPPAPTEPGGLEATTSLSATTSLTATGVA